MTFPISFIICQTKIICLLTTHIVWDCVLIPSVRGLFISQERLPTQASQNTYCLIPANWCVSDRSRLKQPGLSMQGVSDNMLYCITEIVPCEQFSAPKMSKVMIIWFLFKYKHARASPGSPRTVCSWTPPSIQGRQAPRFFTKECCLCACRRWTSE